VISAIIAGQGKRTGDVGIRELFAFQSYLLAFTLVLNLLQKVDLILVKALSSPDATAASANAGFYGAAINIANITYQVIISATFVVFPLVSQATFADDRELTRTYIANTLRYTLIVMALLATLFSANAAGVLHVIYPDPYQAGSGALGWVAFGMLAFGLIYVLTTIISASGRPTVSLTIGLVTFAASAVLNALLIPRLGLTGAGLATTLAMFTGAGLGIGYLLVRFGALLPLLSLLRIMGCSALVYGLSLIYAPASKPLILVKLGALGLIYVIGLIASREIGSAELRLVQRVIRK
jgi:stage V sporulation protein B